MSKGLWLVKLKKTCVTPHHTVPIHTTPFQLLPFNIIKGRGADAECANLILEHRGKAYVLTGPRVMSIDNICPNVPECARMCCECAPECANIFKMYVLQYESGALWVSVMALVIIIVHLSKCQTDANTIR